MTMEMTSLTFPQQETCAAPTKRNTTTIPAAAPELRPADITEEKTRESLSERQRTDKLDVSVV